MGATSLKYKGGCWEAADTATQHCPSYYTGKNKASWLSRTFPFCSDDVNSSVTTVQMERLVFLCKGPKSPTKYNAYSINLIPHTVKKISEVRKEKRERKRMLPIEASWGPVKFNLSHSAIPDIREEVEE